MGKSLVSQAEYAAMAGISRPTVSKLCKNSFKPALSGSRINLEHPVVIAHLDQAKARMEAGEEKLPANNGYTSGNRQTKKEKALSDLSTPNGQPHEIPEDLTPFIDFTLGEIIQKFGADSAFLDWLRSVKIIEEIEEKRLKNAEKRGELIARDLVKKGIIDVVNETHLRMLSDGSKSIANDVVSMALAGADPQQVEIAVSERLTKFIKPGKARMARALKNA